MRIFFILFVSLLISACKGSLTDSATHHASTFQLNDGAAIGATKTVSLQALPASNRIEEFSGSGPLRGFTTNNANSLPKVSQTNGRYHAILTDNTDNITLHFNQHQGRLDAWKTRLPFEFIARNIGIGSINDSQQVHPFTRHAINFAGIQIHAENLDELNSSHVVIGHRGNRAPFTIEGKNTANGSSSVNDIGANTIPNAKADIRIIGDSKGQLTVYWQLPNITHKQLPNPQADHWILYNGTGTLPGPAPNYGNNGSTVYVGLITYAYASLGIPFVGSCDSLELIEH